MAKKKSPFNKRSTRDIKKANREVGVNQPERSVGPKPGHKRKK